MANLFEHGNFITSSGLMRGWKIDVDAVTDEAIEALAHLIVDKYTFDYAYSVPTGGDRIAKAVNRLYEKSFRYSLISGKKLSTPRTKPDHGVFLLLDDVLTTGQSMENMRSSLRPLLGGGVRIQGVVIFNRSQLLPHWIDSIFNLSTEFSDA